MVFARGKIPCDVLFIAEAPGDTEDLLGQPLSGPAGQELDERIECAIDPRVELDENSDEVLVYPRLCFTNIVACIPKDETGKGEPPPEAIKACQGRLIEMIRIAKPKVIILVGKLAAKALPGQATFADLPDGECSWIPNGELIEFAEIVHPAHILRAEVHQRGLMRQRCQVIIADAVEGKF